MTAPTIPSSQARNGPRAAAPPAAPAVLAALALALALAAAWPADARGDLSRRGREALTAELDSIKVEFEAQLAGVGDPGQIAALSIRAAAAAWSAAAEATRPEGLPFPEGRRDLHQDRWDQAEGSWQIRERASMKACFEAISRLAVNLLLSRPSRPRDDESAEELAALLERASLHSPDRDRTPAARLAMDRVFWSNRLNAAAAVLIRIHAPDSRAGLDDILADLLDRAEVICRRADIHYQGRMELLYLNNAQSLARMLFLLASSKGSPLAEEAAVLEEAWNGHAGDDGNQVADTMSVTWVANAQLSFPLALWLASGAGGR